MSADNARPTLTDADKVRVAERAAFALESAFLHIAHARFMAAGWKRLARKERIARSGQTHRIEAIDYTCGVAIHEVGVLEAERDELRSRLVAANEEIERLREQLYAESQESARLRAQLEARK